MRLVISHLFLPPAIGLVHGLLHTRRDLIGIEDNLSIHVSGGTSSCLRQGSVGTQKAFLIRIQDSDQRDFR